MCLRLQHPLSLRPREITSAFCPSSLANGTKYAPPSIRDHPAGRRHEKTCKGRHHSERRRSPMGVLVRLFFGVVQKSSRPPVGSTRFSLRPATPPADLLALAPHRHNHSQQPPGDCHDGFLPTPALLELLEDVPQRDERRTSRQAASTIAQRNKRERFLVIPNSLVLPAVPAARAPGRRRPPLPSATQSGECPRSR